VVQLTWVSEVAELILGFCIVLIRSFAKTFCT
jgi:hypothetical protein